MRVLGFSQRWQKLSNKEFTTFRFPRKDRDWQEGEIVQVVYKPRSKEREIFGEARILEMDYKWVVIWYSGEWGITEEEAQLDGFVDRYDMLHWLEKTHGTRHCYEKMNKLTLRWV